MFEEEAFFTVFFLVNIAAIVMGYRLFMWSIRKGTANFFSKYTAAFTVILVVIGAFYSQVLVPALWRYSNIFSESGRYDFVNMVIVTAVPCTCWILPGVVSFAIYRCFRRN